jgi:hypothetical protein
MSETSPRANPNKQGRWIRNEYTKPYYDWHLKEPAPSDDPRDRIFDVYIEVRHQGPVNWKSWGEELDSLTGKELPQRFLWMLNVQNFPPVKDPRAFSASGIALSEVEAFEQGKIAYEEWLDPNFPGQRLLRALDNPDFKFNPPDAYEDPEVVRFNDVYSRVGGSNTFVFIYDPARDIGMMRPMGGMDMVEMAPDYVLEDEGMNEIDDIGEVVWVDYNHNLLWDTFLKVYGGEGRNWLEHTYRGYWIPDEGTLVFYKIKNFGEGDFGEVPSAQDVEAVVASLSPDKLREPNRFEHLVNLGVHRYLPVTFGPKGTPLDPELIDVVKVIG